MTIELRARRTLSPKVAPLGAMAALLLLWGWLYGRFIGRLFFVLDDWIESEVALARPLSAVIADSFSGALLWSGYRPLTYSLRGLLVHLFGIEAMAGYAAFSLGLHLVNTLLTFHLVRRISPGMRGTAWAFLAAAILLLLPAHNEAILYFSAGANSIALFFALLALHAALTARRSGALWAQAAAVASVAAALLAYEITLSLPLLILLADWGMGHTTLRRRLPMYAGMAAAVAVMLLLRGWVGSGQIGTQRADYALSFAPSVVSRGYALFLGQMLLLHTSAWPHVPLFSNVREWMTPLNPRALASIGLTVLLSATVLFVALRGERGAERSSASPSAPFWMVWGLIWLLLMSLPFAALAGRLPENRYTLIPSFGLAIALSALLAWLYVRAGDSRTLRTLVASGAVALLAFYAYVDTSDVAEWERAATHARSFLDGMAAEAPLALPAATLAQVGVPGNIGTAYVFTTDDSFAAAVRLSSGGVTHAALAGDLALNELITDDPTATERTILLGYDRATHETRRIAQAWFCEDNSPCRTVSFAQPDPTSDRPAWSYVQIANPAAGRGFGILLEPGDPPALRSCWAFADLTRLVVDPSSFDAATTTAQCAAALDALRAAGELATSAP